MNQSRLAALGFRADGASPHWKDADRYVLTVSDLEGREQVGLLFETSAASEELRAVEIVELLLRGPDHWNVIFRNVLPEV